MRNITQKQLKYLKERASSVSKESKKYLHKISRQKPKNLDAIFRKLHEEEFELINCLDCANCCKTISPMIYESDIQRMSSACRMKTSDFKDKYLIIDEEGDYIFKSAPCPFLDSNNYCLIYDQRPKACREYPHTNQKRMYQVLAKTYLNTFICPAVFNIVQKLPKYFR